ncbi:MAG: hypothetical protein WCV62_00980 [Candidatus Peribacteraceae bacterium]|jgi:hypothetical protein
MKSKTLRVALAAGALLLLAGCAPSTPPSSPETTGELPAASAPTVAAPTPSQAGDVGKVTEDVWVEIAAQDIYHGQTDLQAWGVGGGRERFFASFGVTEEQLAAFGAQVENDPARTQEILGKMAKRLKELEDGQ